MYLPNTFSPTTYILSLNNTMGIYFIMSINTYRTLQICLSYVYANNINNEFIQYIGYIFIKSVK